MIGVLEVDYDVVLSATEECFLFIGTLPMCLVIQVACMDFAYVKEMVTYLRPTSSQVYDDRTYSKDASSSYDKNASRSRDYEDSCSSCVKDADSDVCSMGKSCMWNIHQEDASGL